MNISVYLVTHFKGFWVMASKIPWISRIVNKIIINTLVDCTNPRPYPYSMYSHEPAPGLSDYYDHTKWHVTEYTTWQSLNDRTFSGRHLCTASTNFMNALPDLDKAVGLFERKDFVPSYNTSVMFMSFAQWFTDSFLRINPFDLRKNYSNHSIDLCQIYGVDQQSANILRSMKGGKIKTQLINGVAFLPYLYDKGLVKPEFTGLPYANPRTMEFVYRDFLKDPNRVSKFYATGLERGNSTVTYSALNTLFSLMHNYICDELTIAYPNWDDERLFQTSRNILTVILLKIVIEEYINHISDIHFPLFVDPTFAETRRWYRANWMTTEFNLLYRWHPLVPDAISIGGQTLRTDVEFMANNEILEDVGVVKVLEQVSIQRAGRITLSNTPGFLLEAEKRSFAISRGSRLQSFNDYRECFGMKRLTRMEQLTGKGDLLNILNSAYKDIDHVELRVGLVTEEEGDSLLGPLMSRMVASDAFSQALTNPLLSKYVFNEKTFSKKGMQLINEVGSLKEVAVRAYGLTTSPAISFETDPVSTSNK